MFTGIIRAIGTVTQLRPGTDMRIEIDYGRLDASQLRVGDSICCQGVCLTVVELYQKSFCVTAIYETQHRTTAGRWQVGQRLNLERSLRAGESIDGHLLFGHIDAVALLHERQEIGDSLRCIFSLPDALLPFVAEKGSIALDGVSLTINQVQGDQITVALIPHTREWTTLDALRPGDTVNVEIDMLARYAARILATQGKVKT